MYRLEKSKYQGHVLIYQQGDVYYQPVRAAIKRLQNGHKGSPGNNFYTGIKINDHRACYHPGHFTEG